MARLRDILFWKAKRTNVDRAAKTLAAAIVDEDRWEDIPLDRQYQEDADDMEARRVQNFILEQLGFLDMVQEGDTIQLEDGTQVPAPTRRDWNYPEGYDE